MSNFFEDGPKKGGFLDSLYSFFVKYPGGNELDPNIQLMPTGDKSGGMDIYTIDELTRQASYPRQSNGNLKSPRSPSYSSGTYGSWRNQKSYVNNKEDGSWYGLPDYLRHGNDDINTTTY